MVVTPIDYFRLLTQFVLRPLALACSGHPEQEKARPDHTCGPCPLACLLERPGSFCPSLIPESPPPLRALVQSRGSSLRENRGSSGCSSTQSRGEGQGHASALWVLGKLGFFKSEDRCSELGAGERRTGPHASHSCSLDTD